MIWGVREDATGADFPMIERTKQYIKKISEDGYAIMVPSPVVAEYLVGATDTQFHENQIIKRGFEHPDFDVRCAELAAMLQRGGIVNEIHEETGTSKSNIRIDAFIIAIAIVNEAEKIVTDNEREFKKLSRNRIEIIGVPFLPEQTVLNFPDPIIEDDKN
jgi:predicted nucleic acid-binding protein